jgi:hypothetical protein
LLFLRLLFAAGMIGLVVWVIRRAYLLRPKLDVPSSPALPELTPLSTAELRAMEKLARASESLAEALSIRPKIMELVPIAKDERIAANTDQLLREIAREVENERRIAEALEEIDDTRLGDQLTRADDRLREAKDDVEARRLAEGTIERLIAVRDSRDKLRKRRDELSIRTKNLALELRTAQLALLEATSSSGASSERVEEIRARLKQAVDDAQRAALAEDEVARLIARGRESASES